MAKGWTLRYYFIAFIDVLGQSRELSKLDKLPKTPAEMEKASIILHNTAGTIKRLRKGFRTFYRMRDKPTGLLDHLPPEIREKAEQARRIEVIVRSISNAIIIAVPLDNKGDHCVSVGSIYSTLYGICGIFLAALAEKKPFRCGIDIGTGVSLSEGEVYGEALVKAYNLENDSAIYPRIVVGDSLYDYLNTIQNQSSDTEYARLVKNGQVRVNRFSSMIMMV